LPDDIFFKPKVPIWENLESLEMEDVWQFGLFYGYLVYFMGIWYIFPATVSCTKKNLATLISSVETISTAVRGLFVLLYSVEQGDQIGQIFDHWLFVY
jgi:hypothetical protein